MKFKGGTVTIHALELKALAAFGKFESPRAEPAIWFDFGRRTACATDGYTIAYWGQPKRPSVNVLCVPLSAMKRLVALAKRSPSGRVVLGPSVTTGHALPMPKATTLRAPIEKVMRAEMTGDVDASVRWACQARFLARLRLVANVADAAVVVRSPATELSPAEYRIGPDWRVIIMPVRVDEEVLWS